MDEEDFKDKLHKAKKDKVLDDMNKDVTAIEEEMRRIEEAKALADSVDGAPDRPMSIQDKLKALKEKEENSEPQ